MLFYTSQMRRYMSGELKKYYQKCIDKDMDSFIECQVLAGRMFMENAEYHALKGFKQLDERGKGYIVTCTMQ